MLKIFFGCLLLAIGCALTSPARAADADGCAVPARDFSPVVETRKIPPYPPLSQMTGEQGTTRLKVTISADGAAGDVQILKSSGSLRLDEAARDYVKATWRWNPQIKDCKPVEVTTEVSVVWDLKQTPPDPRLIFVTMNPADYPADALARKEQGEVGIVVYISASSELIGAALLRSSGFPDLDSKALELAKTRFHWRAAEMEGKPVATSLLLAMECALPPVPAP